MPYELGQKNGDSTGSTILWLLAGGAAGVGLYYLVLKPLMARPPRPTRPTEVMPRASQTPPSTFANLTAVERRFSELRENYRMGMKPEEALSQIDGLVSATQSLVSQGKASRTDADALLAQLSRFAKDIVDFIELTKGTAAV